MRKNWNIDLEPLLELQRKTKAGEVSPLVFVEIKNFWFWPGQAYWAYCHREKIARKQLTDEEMDSLVKFETVGQLATFLDQIVSEGREKAQPRKRRLWLERCGWLVATLFGLALIWLIFKLLQWLACGFWLDRIQKLYTQDKGGNIVEKSADIAAFKNELGEMSLFLV